MSKLSKFAFQFIIVFSLMFSLASCSEPDYYFEVNNLSSREIIVTYKTWGTDESMQSETIAPKELKLILEQSDPTPVRVGQPVTNWFESIIVVSAPDTIQSKRDFTSDHNWVYELGRFEATITDTDFE